MYIDTSTELNLDETPLAGEKLAALAASSTLVTLHCSTMNLDRAQEALLALRSQNVPALLLLREADNFDTLEEEELGPLFAYLREWGQLSLRNILELCLEWIPLEFQALLEQEAKTELKWLEQWIAAAHDPRIGKVPALPWRSFIRRINDENHAFAEDFLKGVSCPGTIENRKALVQKLRDFLEAKKKAVCIFPKHKRPKEGNA